MAFTNEQLRAIEAEGKVIVSASAGSGKTTVMIEKIIRLITSGVGVDEILAVTFTNKAAAQMKEKLCKALIEEINKPTTDKAKRAALKKQLAGVPVADISTIHAYCSRLIRSHFFLAGVDSGFRVIGGDDADGRALKNAALDELLEEGYEQGEEDFLHLLSSYWRKKKDDALRNIFRDTYDGLRDRADYREYLHRTAAGYTEEDFERVCTDLLALFQEKCRYYYELVEDERAYFTSIEGAQKQLQSCEELLSWLRAYGEVGDYFAARAVEKPALTPKSSSKKDSEEKRAHIERLAFLKGRITKAVEGELGEVATREEELSRFLSSGKTAAALAKQLLIFDGKYAEKKEERGVLDYNDLEHKALALLSDPEIAEETRKRYRFVFVDEYQDVNPVQEKILSLLAGKNLFLVGDIKQAIYGFRGSKSKFFAEKQRTLADGDGQSLLMTYNFRSAGQVLDAVNKQFSLAMTPRVCAVDYARDSFMERGGRYAANSGSVQIHFNQKEEKTAPARRGVYSVRENTERKEEGASNAARLVAQIIQAELAEFLDDPSAPNGKRRVEYRDIAVLTRKKGGDIVEEVAALSDLGIPVTTASAVNICEYTEVKALVDILSLLDNAEQDVPLCSALLSGMGKVTADELASVRLAYKGLPFRTACKKYAREQKDSLSQKLTAFYAYFNRVRTEACVLSVGEVLAKILADTQMEAGLLARPNGRACLKRIRRFIEEASSFGGDSVHDFLAYLRNLDYKIEYSENGGEDSVKVVTMHSSKGLEFPIVILPNLSQPFRGGRTPEVYVEEEYGLAPRAFDGEKMLRYPTLLRKLFERKEERSSLADELNLYYVALTRAEQKLHLIFEERTAMPDFKYAKSYAELTDFSVWEEYIVHDDLLDLRKAERQALLQPANEGTVHQIMQAIAWQYPHAGYENLPVKSSPTQLMEGGKYLPKQRFTDFGREEQEEREDARELAVQEGTAYHAFLECFDFALLTEGGKPIAREKLALLVAEALPTMSGEVNIALLREEKLVEILSNPVFYSLQGARLYKEQQFLVSLPVKDTYARKEGVDPALAQKEGEEMLFQGAIDLLAVGEEVQIIDYKYSTRSAEVLRAHYKPQLDLYRLAVAKVLRVPKENIKCSVVNIREGFQVDMD